MSPSLSRKLADVGYGLPQDFQEISGLVRSSILDGSCSFGLLVESLRLILRTLGVEAARHKTAGWACLSSRVENMQAIPKGNNKTNKNHMPSEVVGTTTMATRCAAILE